MIFQASNYVFTPPPLVSRARRILIKPNIMLGDAKHLSTSRHMMSLIIERIKQVSDADIVILEGTATGESMHPIYKELGYDFPRVLTLDVRECTWVEVENPLPHPYAITNFWVPNIVLSSDYLIGISSYRVNGRHGFFSIKSLLSLLPIDKYKGHSSAGWDALAEFGMDKVFADLYFTLPFDFGIIDATQKFIGTDKSDEFIIEEYGQIFAGEPYGIDREATHASNLETDYLDLIDAGKAELEAWG